MKYQIHYDKSALSWRQYNWTHCLEWLYIPELITELSKYLSDEWKVIFTSEDFLPDFEGHDPDKILVFKISDEKYQTPSYAKDVRAVFKNYVNGDKQGDNVYPIPQGPMTGFVSLPYRKPKDRSIDVLFTGNWHTSRRGILEGLKARLGDKCNIVFLENNCVTMVQPTYSHYIMDSKISLDLSGALGPETFRYYESLKSGCVTLSYEKPDNWIYRNNPTLVPDWGNLDSIADLILSLLDDEEKLLEISAESVKFYQQRYNPQSVVENHILPHIGMCGAKRMLF